MTRYEKFRASYGRDGPDYALVEAASGKERERLEDDLIAHLDGFAIPALGLLRSAKAVPVLKERLAVESGATKVLIAKALWTIEANGDCPGIIASVLHSGRDAEDRMEAAMALRGIDAPEVDLALQKGLFDVDFGVRYHSAWSLADNRGCKYSPKQWVAAVGDGDKEKIQALLSEFDASRGTRRQAGRWTVAGIVNAWREWRGMKKAKRK